MEADPKQPFLWQLNLTKRESKGEFGRYVGYERTIIQISGKTITLQHRAQGDQKLTPLVPYTFNADWQTRRALIGKAEDLNVFVRSKRLISKVERIDLKDRKPFSKFLSRYTVLWVYQGSIEWECSGEKVMVNERGLLFIEGVVGLEYILKAKRAICFAVNIDERY